MNKEGETPTRIRFGPFFTVKRMGKGEKGQASSASVSSLVSSPEPTESLDHLGDRLPHAVPPALASDGALMLLEAGDNVVGDALPRGLDVVVGEG